MHKLIPCNEAVVLFGTTAFFVRCRICTNFCRI